MWLLDTMVISEPTKPNANEQVLAWLSDQTASYLHTSVLCLGEIRRGVERLAPGAKRSHLRSWLETDLPDWFGARELPIDSAIAQLWGEMTASADRTVPVVDGLIAATATRHKLTVVTRNTKDYSALDVPVFNPWVDA